MLFTAAIMLCLQDEPHTYENCQIINAEWKYPSEEICWAAINGKLATMVNAPELMRKYKVTDAKCISWIEKKQEL